MMVAMLDDRGAEGQANVATGEANRARDRLSNMHRVSVRGNLAHRDRH